jgi:hypothetical protein
VLDLQMGNQHDPDVVRCHLFAAAWLRERAHIRKRRDKKKDLGRTPP